MKMKKTGKPGSVAIPHAILAVAWDGIAVACVRVTVGPQVIFQWAATGYAQKQIVVPGTDDVMQIDLGPNHARALVMACGLAGNGMLGEVYKGIAAQQLQKIEGGQADAEAEEPQA